MPPLNLPSHLSYRSSLVVVPVSSIQEPIQTLRRKHDKHFQRWPPHINLIYPFLASPTESQTSSEVESSDQSKEPPVRKLRTDIISRVRKAVRDVRPFTVLLDADTAGVFKHGKKSATVWLRPVDVNEAASGHDEDSEPFSRDGEQWNPKCSNPIKDLQAALQREFAECDTDTRPFTPHLSVGQAAGAKAAEALVEQAKKIIQEFLESTNGVSEYAGVVNKGGLVWHVDRLFVIERMAFHDPFRIVGQIELNGQ